MKVFLPVGNDPGFGNQCRNCLEGMVYLGVIPFLIPCLSHHQVLHRFHPHLIDGSLPNRPVPSFFLSGFSSAKGGFHLTHKDVIHLQIRKRTSQDPGHKSRKRFGCAICGFCRCFSLLVLFWYSFSTLLIFYKPFPRRFWGLLELKALSPPEAGNFDGCNKWGIRNWKMTRAVASVCLFFFGGGMAWMFVLLLFLGGKWDNPNIRRKDTNQRVMFRVRGHGPMLVSSHLQLPSLRKQWSNTAIWASHVVGTPQHGGFPLKFPPKPLKTGYPHKMSHPSSIFRPVG